MDRSDKIFEAGALTLESGLTLPNTRVAYRTWGALNEARDNVVFISHALTGNAAVDSYSAFFDNSKFNQTALLRELTQRGVTHVRGVATPFIGHALCASSGAWLECSRA